MQFLIIGLDGTDDSAINRRIAVREEHIKLGDELVRLGNVWYGAVLLDDEGKMKGSVFIVDFPSEKELNEWLEKEPYVTGDVWRDITIHKCSTRDPWQFNRPKEFFKKRKN